MVYASNASGDWDILRYQIGTAPGSAFRTIAGGPGDQDQPDVNGTNVIYRGPAGIYILNWDVPSPVRTPHPPAPGESQACPFERPVSNPSIGAQVAAWECGEGSRDVAVFRFGLQPEEYVLMRPGAADAAAGDQHAPAAFGDYVAFVDEGDGGSVWLHDSNPWHRGTTFVCDGRATGIAIGDFERTIIAVARSSNGHDEDVEIWDASGLVTALRVDGVQQNPHLSGDWVAFEDLSTGRSQVVLWQWTSGIVYVPHPSTTNQTLNDVAATRGVDVRVVFADDADGTGTARDIALYRLAFEDGAIPDDGGGSSWPWGPPHPPAERPPPANCGDLDPVVLATLALGRDTGTPLAESIAFDAPPFPGDPALPVLVCIDSDHVTAGWVALDDAAIAMPGDFDPHLTRLAIPAVAENGGARISGVIAGKPGRSLVARVLADPGRIEATGGELRPVPARARSVGNGNCGNPGGALSAAALALLVAMRIQRRR